MRFTPDEANGGGQEHEDAVVRVSVGTLLRLERERRGLTLDDLAVNLRIRRAQLDAIENGRFNELPGAPYAVGFVRAYAEFLELDRDEIVRRFKAEAAGLDNRKELHFPQPLSESRLPGGVVLLFSALIAAGAYGFWYFQNSAEREPLPRVAEVPERLAPLAEPQAALDDGAKEAAPPAASEPTIERPATPSVASAAMSATTTDPATAVATAAPQPAAMPAPAPDAASIAAATPVATSTPSPDGDTAPGVQEPAPADAASVAAAPGDAALIPAPPAEVSPPRVFGEAAGISRVVIRATGDSWIQVRDDVGNIVFTRVLRPGDVYNVPNRVGLELYTGSAGALDIRVDGQPTPSLGKPGSVRRDVSLDPDRLLAGTAIGENRPAAGAPAAVPADPPAATSSGG